MNLLSSVLLFLPLNLLPFISGEIWKPEDALASYGEGLAPIWLIIPLKVFGVTDNLVYPELTQF